MKKPQKMTRKTRADKDIMLYFCRVRLVIIAELHGSKGAFWARIGVFDGYVHFVYPDKINIT